MGVTLRFLGAAGTVTGSAYLVETARTSVLVDFGVFQGAAPHANDALPAALEPERLEAVLLTHAHLDHTGRLPLLARAASRAPIYATEATIPLTGLILRDSAHLQAMDLERVNRKRERAGEPPLEPSFTAGDVERVMDSFVAVPYDAPVEVAPGISCRWVEAGHMLGSASLQLIVQSNGGPKTLVFSGDIGPRGAPILEDAVGFAAADAVVMESTYGDRDNRTPESTVAEFEEIVSKAVAHRAKLLVPVFAIGRAQLLLYLLARMFRRRVVAPFPVYLDSPMGIEATRIYWEHLELFDDEFQTLQRERPLLQDLSTLTVSRTAQESRLLNDVSGPCLIMAGSGMCTGGRILHHLKNNLWRPGTRVLIVGYQGEGSLGRQLVDGAEHVTIFGERIAARATVHTLNGFSAHAGQSGLLRWLGRMADSRPRVFLTHGEARGREPLAGRIAEEFGLSAELPEHGQAVEL